MRRGRTMIAAATVLGGAAFSPVPNDTLTPGAVATSDHQAICGGEYSRTHRRTGYELKEWVAREYGIDRHAGDWEIDHRIPLCLGGADTAANLWPQPGAGPLGYHEKDALEWRACRAVCAGKLELSDAVGWFRGDWRQAYQRILGRAD